MYDRMVAKLIVWDVDREHATRRMLRALGEYDARGFASSVDVPTAVVVTTRDRLVRPRKQRALAEAVPDARVFELDGDHDACLVSAGPFRSVTVAALRSVGAGAVLREAREA